MYYRKKLKGRITLIKKKKAWTWGRLYEFASFIASPATPAPGISCIWEISNLSLQGVSDTSIHFSVYVTGARDLYCQVPCLKQWRWWNLRLSLHVSLQWKKIQTYLYLGAYAFTQHRQNQVPRCSLSLCMVVTLSFHLFCLSRKICNMNWLLLTNAVYQSNFRKDSGENGVNWRAI